MSWLIDLTPSERIAAIVVAALLALSACLWYRILCREFKRQLVIPLARRRPVPWLGRDVLFIFLIAFVLPLLATQAVHWIIGGDRWQEAAPQKLDTVHPAEQLLRSRKPTAVVVAVVMAVFVAPIFEEFLFRVLLQGWLETVWNRKRRVHAVLRTAPQSWLPVVLPALFFAAMHFRPPREPHSIRYLTLLFLAQMAGQLLTLGLAIAVLRFGVRATPRDLGWQPRRLAADAKLSFVALLTAMPPLLIAQYDLLYAAEKYQVSNSLDPIPLFFLALVFGALYQRTHRIAPSLLLHMAFNATSVTLFFVTK